MLRALYSEPVSTPLLCRLRAASNFRCRPPDFEFPRVSDAVAHLAEVRSKFHYDGDDIDIPVDIIALLCQRYGASIVPLDILYDIYLESYLINIGKKTHP